MSEQALSAQLVTSGGKLTGARGVDVAEKLYNVEFVDGTCVALFSGCDDQSDFPFKDSLAGDIASQALLDQVFLDVPLSGQFDSIPGLTRGCGGERCNVLTPLELGDPRPHLVFFEAANNYGPSATDIGGSTGDFGINFNTGVDDGEAGSDAQWVWARWSPASTVPEPAAVLWLGIAGFALVLVHRRRSFPGRPFH